MASEPEPGAAATADVILVGGGLANALIAWRIADLRPELRIVLIERGDRIGGNHTWSFHTTDVTAAQLAWIGPLVDMSWTGQEVRFPGHVRRLATGYHSVSAERLHRAILGRFGAGVWLCSDAAEVAPGEVRLGVGARIRAPLVIDGRGALAEQALALGYQKFVGVELETSAPHGLHQPIIMDATVPQSDGYRFVYTLPLSGTRLLIEDTYYSDAPALDRARIAAGIGPYAAARGWVIARELRQESGVLPIALAGDIDQHWATLGRELPRSGLRAWLFHATTGYSLPFAVRLADEITALPTLASRPVAARIEAVSRQVWSGQAFYRLLNRMLFLAATPAERVNVLERFYRLPEPLIQRFYAGRSTVADKARILTGKPPVPIGRALRCLGAAGAWAFDARQRSAATGAR